MCLGSSLDYKLSPRVNSKAWDNWTLASLGKILNSLSYGTILSLIEQVTEVCCEKRFLGHVWLHRWPFSNTGGRQRGKLGAAEWRPQRLTEGEDKKSFHGSVWLTWLSACLACRLHPQNYINCWGFRLWSQHLGGGSQRIRSSRSSLAK